ncbi:uncharacterized membrane protein, possible Na+ channel or pump [Rubidibacter lacunae KORDI 51-2]|uniref:Uncharacterized membrane protein, possible Na+ channel or pump n=1 Tax=Rubidibacter lacunae KORDI 51-2 TaxID=582515 RepID=U5DE35_9CHRO|nr:DUF554 domain-containing protein [Rubidibacter lacunae]ERN42768.1 uncharacterized membrane protein, possible Na+ channel or pump [Rubidibacter lacunae KORDI 51-2]
MSGAILELWTRTSGTWINIATVIAGTVAGALLQRRLPQRVLRVITQGVGLLTLWLGFSMAESLTAADAGAIAGPVLGLLVLALGGAIGEWWSIEERLARVGTWVQQRWRGRGSFTDGFVAASLLFCVGPLALLGSLTNGSTGDNTLLVLKASMDGLAAIALASTYGSGVGFSVLSLLVYQGGLSLLAGWLTGALPDPAIDPRLALATGVGGLTIVGIGLGLLDIARVRVASFLPALLLAPGLYGLAIWLQQF